MKTFITKNSNGFVYIWLEEPKRNNHVKKWQGKFFLIDSILYEKSKDLIKDIDFDWNSEPLVMSF